MALIKGAKFGASGDEQEPNQEHPQEQPPEEQVKKGGLIKGRKVEGDFPPDDMLQAELGLLGVSLQQPQASKGKVLKGKWTTVQKADEQTESDQDFSGKETQVVSASGFQPASFLSQPGGLMGQDASKDVVVIPARDPVFKPVVEEESPPPETEFKVEQPEPVPQVDIDAIIAEAERQGREKAEKIIEHAQEEAKRLIDQAKIYGETTKKEAHEEGMRLGKDDGYKQGLAQFTAVMEEAKNVLSQIVKEREAILNAIEPELAKLSLQISEKIIGEEVKTNPDVVINLVRQAMSKMRSREEIILRVNPEDFERVKQNKDVFAALVEGIKNLDIQADPRVDRGGCLFETNLGNTDARIATQLTAIELAFKKAETGQL